MRTVRALLPQVAYSVSATTRPPRAGEREAADYRFVSAETFDAWAREGAFLEHADVFGRRYGTLAGPVDDELRAGRDVLLEIDVAGAAQVRGRRPDAILIFLLPPSRDELERRLRRRGTEDDGDLARRLAGADREMEDRAWFDHVVVNDDADRAAQAVADIIVRSH